MQMRRVLNRLRILVLTFITLALDASASCLGCFRFGERPSSYSQNKRLGEPQIWFGHFRGKRVSCPVENWTQILQPST